MWSGEKRRDAAEEGLWSQARWGQTGHLLGSEETPVPPARTPTGMMTCAPWPSTGWTSHRPLGLSGSWAPASSASSTRNLIGVTIELALLWPTEALCGPCGRQQP